MSKMKKIGSKSSFQTSRTKVDKLFSGVMPAPWKSYFNVNCVKLLMVLKHVTYANFLCSVSELRI